MVIGTNTDRLATYDFLSVTNSNHGPTLYHFWGKERFESKVANFPNPSVFSALTGFTLEFCNTGKAQ